MKKILSGKALKILIITNGFILTAGAMLGPVYALFVEEVGGDLLSASLTGSIFAITAGITTLFAGRIIDKNNISGLTLASGYLVKGLGFFLYIFANSIWFLFAIQILIGFAEAFYCPAFDALFSKHATQKKAASQWGAWEATNYFAVAIGSVVGGLIANQFGFNAIFIIMGVLCCLSSVYVFYVQKKFL